MIKNYNCRSRAYKLSNMIFLVPILFYGSNKSIKKPMQIRILPKENTDSDPLPLKYGPDLIL